MFFNCYPSLPEKISNGVKNMKVLASYRNGDMGSGGILLFSNLLLPAFGPTEDLLGPLKYAHEIFCFN